MALDRVRKPFRGADDGGARDASREQTDQRGLAAATSRAKDQGFAVVRYD